MVGARWQLCEVLSEGCAVQVLLVDQRADVLALGVDGAGEADSLVAGVEDGVVAVEEVQAEDPVADLRTVHQSQLALARGVLDICAPRKLIGYIIDSEGHVFERGVVFTRASCS